MIQVNNKLDRLGFQAFTKWRSKLRVSVLKDLGSAKCDDTLQIQNILFCEC